MVKKIDYNAKALRELREETHNNELLFDYPTVYLIYKRDANGQYNVYVGETNNIRQRTKQHLIEDPKTRKDWKAFRKEKGVNMIVIGHDQFNKSLTLDIENKMMLYMSGVTSVKKLNNRRENDQNKYYTEEVRDNIFSKVWRKLRKLEGNLFPLERIIQDSALFKASPFHKLTSEQIEAKDLILERLMTSLLSEQENQLILVEGEAGSGKTVLLSSIFYLLHQYSNGNEHPEFKNLSSFLLVNHDEQLKVYNDIIKELEINSKEVVSKPTHFITTHDPKEKVDVVLVDEAHLLWTQGKQSYQGKNQLKDIMARAKVVVAIFDPKQVLKTEGYLEDTAIRELEAHAELQKNLVRLENQMRINADEETVSWIRALTDQREVWPIHQDSKGYDLRIFDDPVEMYHQIKLRNEDRDNAGLSRMVATFDWDYKQKGKPDDGDHWMVDADNLHLPWNLQLPIDEDQKHMAKKLAWSEQKQTIGEIGSTYTIQGFDLNYCGVIIGPSVKYRNGKIIFDPNESHNSNAIRQRTLDDGRKEYVSDQLLANELNVLLTRGVNGLYLYAVDEKLRNKLISEYDEL